MGIDEQIKTIERTLNNEAVGEAVKSGLRVKLEELKKQQSGKPEEPSESFEDKVRKANAQYFSLVDRGLVGGTHKFIEDKKIVDHLLKDGSSVLYEIMDDFTMQKVNHSVIRPEKTEDRPKRLSQLKRWLKDNVGKTVYLLKGVPWNYQVIPKQIKKVQTNDFSLENMDGSESWVEFGKAKDLVIDPYGFKPKGNVYIMYDRETKDDTKKWFEKNLQPIHSPKQTKDPEEDPKVKQTSDFTYKGWRAVRDTISTTQGTLRLSKDGVKIDYGLGVSPANYEDGRKNPHFKTDEEIKEIIDMLIINEPKARKMASFHNESWEYLLKLPRPEFNFKWQTYQDAMPKNEFINEVKKELINQFKMDRADAFKLVGSQNKNILDHWRNGKSHIDVATLLFANYKDMPGRNVKPESQVVDINEEFVLDIQDPKSVSGRKLTPYPKQKSDRYFWAWMKENALEEHKSDRYKRGLIEAIDLKNLSPSDKTDLNLFLFGVENARITGHKKPKQSEKPKQTERVEKVISLWKGFDKEFNEKGLHSKTLNMPNESMMKAFIDDFEKSGFKDKYYLTRNPVFKGKISITKRYSGESYKGLTFDEYKYLAIVSAKKSAFRQKYFDKYIKTELNSIKQSLADKGFLTAGKALNSKGSDLVESITVENFDRKFIGDLANNFEAMASKFGEKPDKKEKLTVQEKAYFSLHKDDPFFKKALDEDILGEVSISQLIKDHKEHVKKSAPKMSKTEAKRLRKKYKDELKVLYQRRDGAYEMFINDKGNSLDKVNKEIDIVLKRLNKVNKIVFADERKARADELRDERANRKRAIESTLNSNLNYSSKVSVLQADLDMSKDQAEKIVKKYESQAKKRTVKIGDEEVDCDDLIAEERKKLEKKREQSKKQNKKRESTKNIQRIDKATKKIETSIQERLEDGKTLSKSEIDKLIKECEDLITKLKDYLKQIRR